MAVIIAERQVDELTTNLQKKRSHQRLVELRETIVECNEECGLLMYNVLQEFAIVRRQGFGEDMSSLSSYASVLRAARHYFESGLARCESFEVSHEVQFRLHYMLGKVLKKRRDWVSSQPHNDADKLQIERDIMQCFARAEQEHEDGNMERSIIHAFYQLQAMRMQLVIADQPSVEELKLVCDHFFEDAPEAENDDDNGGQTDENANEGDSNDEGGGRNQAEAGANGNRKSGALLHHAPGEKSTDPSVGKDDIKGMLDASSSQPQLLLLARAWLFLNVLEALKSISDEDRYFHPSRYLLARAMYRLDRIAHPSLSACTHESVGLCLEQLQKIRQNEEESTSISLALQEMGPLFDKRRPQIVAIWLSEHIPVNKKFEELNQRQMKFDAYRLKYWSFYVKLLRESESYARLKEIAAWVIACKEDHDVVDEMLGIVLDACGAVQLTRISRLFANLPAKKCTTPVKPVEHIAASATVDLTTTDAPEELLLKALSKAYTHLSDVTEAQKRVERIMPALANRLVKRAQFMVASLFAIGVAEFGFKDSVPSDANENERWELVSSMAVPLKNMVLSNGDGTSIDDVTLTEHWGSLLSSAREYCDTRWIERQSKGKTAKPRPRQRAPATSSSGTDPQPAIDVMNEGSQEDARSDVISTGDGVSTDTPSSTACEI
ncbi:hypothetical protein PINS_up015009 [Pythium insidiosum]|nr:hypothetical protein PINS_up015009 [Pythium insidiosum]